MEAEEDRELSSFNGSIVEGRKVEDLEKLAEAFQMFKGSQKDVSLETRSRLRGKAVDLMREAFSS